jgi:hypothetical protein
MAGFKLMTNDEYKNYIMNGNLISNMNQGIFGTPIYLKSATVQTSSKSTEDIYCQ